MYGLCNAWTAINLILKWLWNDYPDDYIIGAFLDFSNAVDTVSHSIVSDIFYHYGIRGNTLKLFRSYFTQRKQYVTYNSTPSNIKLVNCGMPQRSILFLIYINDLSNVCKYTMPVLFGDDLHIFASSDGIQLLQSQINGICIILRFGSKWINFHCVLRRHRLLCLFVFVNVTMWH